MGILLSVLGGDGAERSEIRSFASLSSLATGCRAKPRRSFSERRNWPSCSSVQHERGKRGIMEDHPMRKTLLLTTALLAGVTLASAQSPNNRQYEGATQSKQAQEHQTPQDRTTGQSTQRDREGQNQRQGNAQNQREEHGNQHQGEAQQGQNQRQGNAQNQRDERRN